MNKLLTTISNLTDMNNHTMAISAGCHSLNMFVEVEQLLEIDEKYINIGHLTEDLRAKRHAIYTKMLKVAGVQLSADDFNNFYNCY